MKTKRIALATIALCISIAINAQAQEKYTDLLKGKTINVIGDSYVANHKRSRSESWHSKFAQKHGMTYNNYGRNGGCVAFDRTKEGFGPSLMVRYNEMSKDADIIVIIAGHNDATKIGQSKDSLKMFTDSLSLLLTTLKETYPNTKIGYVTPWFVDRDGFSQTIKAIKKVCRKHDIPLLNNYRKKSIIKVRDPKFRKQYFQGENDTAHLNNAGHDLFLPIGEEFIISMFKE
jgi:lysophospholipase L1-like esterase